MTSVREGADASDVRRRCSGAASTRSCCQEVGDELLLRGDQREVGRRSPARGLVERSISAPDCAAEADLLRDRASVWSPVAEARRAPAVMVAPDRRRLRRRLRLLQAPDRLDERRRRPGDVEADQAAEVAGFDGAGPALGLARGQPALRRVVAERLLVVQRQREARADPAIVRLGEAVAAVEGAAVRSWSSVATSPTSPSAV